MKNYKILLVFNLILFVYSSMKAQSCDFCPNVNSLIEPNCYNFDLDSGVNTNTPFDELWSTFPNAGPAAYSNTRFYSSPNSLRFGASSDAVFGRLNFNQSNAGTIRMDFLMYCEPGTTARVGGMYEYTGTIINDFAYVIQFNSGNGVVQETNDQFVYPESRWFRVVQIINLEEQKVELWVNNEFVSEWDYHIGNPNLGNENLFDGLNFWRVNGTFYIDNFCLQRPNCETILCLDVPPEVCVNGNSYTICEARCNGFTEHEWDEGACVNGCTCVNILGHEILECNSFEQENIGSDTDDPFDPLWTTIPSSANNTFAATISGVNSYEGDQSLSFDTRSVVLYNPNGTYENIKLRNEWLTYIESGTQSNFGLLYDNSGYYAYHVRMQNGTGELWLGHPNNPIQSLTTFSYPENSWFRIVQLLDLSDFSESKIELWIDEEFVQNWNYDDGIPGLGNDSDFDGLVIWSDSGRFYLDNMCTQQQIFIPSCNSDYEPVCVNGMEFSNECEANNLCYTEHEWEEGPCEEEECCLECFDFIFDRDDVNRCYFYNNYCDESEFLRGQESENNLSYVWSIIPPQGLSVDFGAYVNGTDQFSPNPVYDFGDYFGPVDICFEVYQGGEILLYECCYTILVPQVPCYTPPTCFIDFDNNGTLRSNRSTNIEQYKWEFDDAVLDVSSSDNSPELTFNSNFAGCTTVCLIGTNGCGVSSTCIEICSSITESCGQLASPVITPTISNLTVDFLDTPLSDGYAWSVKTISDTPDYNFVNGTDENSKNPSIRFDDYGCYFVCVEIDRGIGCSITCMCWTICLESDKCENEVCSDEFSDSNCNQLLFDYQGPTADGGFNYSLEAELPSIQDEICRWVIERIDTDETSTINSGDLGITYGYPASGLYRVCYIWKDFSEDCYRECCRDIYVDDPFACGDDIIAYSVDENNQMVLSLDDPSFIDLTWIDDDTNQVIGNGNSVSIPVPTENNCRVINISVRYFDTVSGCWYICCKSIWLCPPSNCQTVIDYNWVDMSGEGEQYLLTLNNSENIDLSTLTWSIIDNNGVETNISDTGDSQATYLPNPNNCGIRTICVRYRDILTGCWYLCCRQINLCPPSQCEETIGYYFNGETIEVELLANAETSSIEWIINQNFDDPFAVGTNTAIPFNQLSESCFTRTIVVKYLDPSTGCWYFCSRRIRFCPPVDCEDEVLYNFDIETNAYLFSVDNSDIDFNQEIIWSDDTAGTQIGSGQNISYPFAGACGPRWISVRYFNSNTRQWQICCRLVYICNPFECADVINFSEGLNGNTTFSVANNFNTVSWLIDGVSEVGNTITSSIPVGVPVRICVFYRDPSTNCFYICCRTISVGSGCENPMAAYSYSSTNLVVEFANSSTSTTGNVSYFWDFGDGGSSSFLNPTHTFLQPGDYEVCLTVSDDCGSDTECQTISVSQSLNTLVFEVLEENCGGQGDIIWIPVVAQNFDNVVTFSKAINIENASIARFTGDVRNIIVDELSPQDFAFNSNTSLGVFYTGGGDGDSVADGVVLYELGVELLANFGNSTEMTIEGMQAKQIVNGLFQDMNVVSRSNSICVENTSINLSGRITTVEALSNRPIQNVEVNLSEGAALVTNTDLNGEYNFIGLNGQLDYTITPQSNTDYKNGVDPFDAFLIKHHISGQAPFDEKHNFIAGDIDGSGVVDVFDSFIAKNIFLDRLPNSQIQFPAWKFIKRSDWLQLPSNPLLGSYSEEITEAEGDDNDFVGIKIGDIDGDARTGLKDDIDLSNRVNQEDDIIISTSSAMGEIGSVIDVDLNVENFSSIITLSFGLEWDMSQLEFLGVKDIKLQESGEDDFFLSEEGDSFVFIWTGPFDGQSIENMSSIATLSFRIVGQNEGNTQLEFTDPFSARNSDFEIVGISTIPGNVSILPMLEDIGIIPSINEISCFNLADGSIELQVIGGSGDFTITWNNGAQGPFIDNLSSGTYQATILDNVSNQVLETDLYVIENPQAIDINASVDNINCFGDNDGSISLSASGGSGFLSYNWNNQVAGPNNQNLMPGQYLVTVSDENGCEEIRDFEISEPSRLELSEEIVHVDCFSDSDGSIVVDVEGGEAPYQYNWNNNNNTSLNQNLTSGTYSLEVIDANNCYEQETYFITEPDEITANFDLENDIIDETASNVVILVSGGVSPYTYRWSDSNQQTSETALGLTGGTYLCEVIDANSCREIFEVDVPFRGTFSIQSNVVNNPCFDSNLGRISLNTVEGSGEFLFQWSTGATSATISNLSNGIYTVTVTDINVGFQIEEQFQITSPERLRVGGLAVRNSCFGANDGSISLQAAGGEMPYTYNWNNGATINSIFGLQAGDYFVTITDFNNCQSVHFYEIEEMDEIQVDVVVEDDPNTPQTGTVSISPSGNSYTFDILWSDGSTDFERSGLPIGTYTAVITDPFQCSVEITVVISDQIVSTTDLVQVDWNVYPNPTSGSLFVEMDSQILKDEGSIQVFNLTGQLLIDYQLDKDKKEEIELQLNYAPGVYLVVYKSQLLTASTKVVLTK